MEPLMSQRYAPLNHYPRPKFSSMVNSLVLQQAPKAKAVVFIPKQPFRMLDLPAEIRQLVYVHYFGQWEATLDYERLTMLRSKFKVMDVPSVDLLLVCRRVYYEARAIRLNTFSGRLNLNNVFILVSLPKKERFDWLRQNVRTLHFSDSSIHPERWNRYYDNFPNLKKLEIEFPNIVRLDHRCSILDEVLQGRHDTLLLESLDTFRLTLVEQLKVMVQVVVSQQYCFRDVVGGWRGILHVKILLSEDGTYIVERSHDQGVSVVSKRQFRLPSEL